MKTEQRPHAQDGRVCGAKTRSGQPCRNPKMPNGRCRMHGGCSTGPKSLSGRERISRARLKHGRYTKEAKADAAEVRRITRELRALLR